jgi:succinoglycan biosynthesis transport protein ExoP
MIDIIAYLKYIWRHKWLVILVPLICGGITFFALRNMPKDYVSMAQLSTGISDRSQEILSQGNMDYYRVSQQFTNLIESIKSKRVLNRMSLKLMIHDLSDPSKAFKEYSDPLKELSATQRAEVVQLYQEKLDRNEFVVPVDKGKYPIYAYLKSMGYTDEQLSENLGVNRHSETDFINIDFISENPELSTYFVNTLAEDFVDYYHSSTSSSEATSMAILDSILNDRQINMNLKNEQLRSFKSAAGVVNAGAQAETLGKQIADLESQQTQINSRIASLIQSITDLDRRINNPNNQDFSSGTSANNSALIRIMDQLRTARSAGAPQRTIDSLENIRTNLLATQGGGVATNPQTIRANLINDRNKAETELAAERGKIGTIERNLATLKGRYYAMAPADANIQNLEREAEIATNEYTDAMNRYNQASVGNVAGLKLKIVQYGYPGLPKSSKKIIFLAASGIGSGVICLAALLFMFLLDNKIESAQQLSERTGGKVVGSINLIEGKDKDLRNIWSNVDHDPSYGVYQELIRALRFEITNNILVDGNKVLGVTSLRPGEGKTFLTSSLAYAFALIGKKVLLIGDGTTDLTSLVTNSEDHVEADAFETFLVKKEIKAEDLITVLNRNPNNNSILELKHANNLIAGFDVLKETFDIILIDVDNLRNVNKAKEWLMFADKTIGVFKWGTSIQDHDKEFLSYLTKFEGFSGWVFNQVKVDLTTKKRA